MPLYMCKEMKYCACHRHAAVSLQLPLPLSGPPHFKAQVMYCGHVSSTLQHIPVLDFVYGYVSVMMV